MRYSRGQSHHQQQQLGGYGRRLGDVDVAFTKTYLGSSEFGENSGRISQQKALYQIQQRRRIQNQKARMPLAPKLPMVNCNALMLQIPLKALSQLIFRLSLVVPLFSLLSLWVRQAPLPSPKHIQDRKFSASTAASAFVSSAPRHTLPHEKQASTY